jgi:hypothetical protein
MLAIDLPGFRFYVDVKKLFSFKNRPPLFQKCGLAFLEVVTVKCLSDKTLCII